MSDAPPPPDGAEGDAPHVDAHDAAAHAAGEHGGHRHKHPEHPEFGPSAPLWMLSFADMMTNLLCFFILLSAFAPKQEGVLLEDGLGSIKRALISIGLPGTMDGRRNPVQFNAGRVVYRPAASVNASTLVEADGRILDANRDTLRQVIVETMAKRGSATVPMPMLFEADVTELSSGHQAFLDEVAKYVSAGRFSVRIDGYAFEEGVGAAAGFRLSEARARAARDHLISAGIAASRIAWTGHGPLSWGEGTKAGAAPSPQNQFGRRAVLVTFLET